jgi:hypothetical protein
MIAVLGVKMRVRWKLSFKSRGKAEGTCLEQAALGSSRASVKASPTSAFEETFFCLCQHRSISSKNGANSCADDP